MANPKKKYPIWLAYVIAGVVIVLASVLINRWLPGESASSAAAAPYAAVQQFSPWELVVADGVAMPDLGEQESASMNKLEGKTYSVSAKETVGESDAESNLPC